MHFIGTKKHLLREYMGFSFVGGGLQLVVLILAAIRIGKIIYERSKGIQEFQFSQ